jgi:peptidyl-prolyl cis-trans isomerase SurA
MKLKQILLIPIIFIFNTSNLFSQTEEGTYIDGVVAIVGRNVVLNSEIETQYLQLTTQGGEKPSKDLKCEILEDLMLQSLLLTQAEIDSIELTYNEVESEMDRRLKYFISQIGSRVELEKYYNK